MSEPQGKETADIFCRIIDNYGDIGVCWRLARQLHAEYFFKVTLWVDDLATFARLNADVNPALALQNLNGITVRHWSDDFFAPQKIMPTPASNTVESSASKSASNSDANPADIFCSDLIIEGFACELPPEFLRAMHARTPAPLWINLDYLSAEPWVENCHGLPSVHAQTGLKKYFWFPGFTARTGGLLREQTLLPARDDFQQSTAQQADFFARIGLPHALNFPQRISLFAYENPALHGVLSALKNATQRTLLIIPQGRVLADVGAWLRANNAAINELGAGSQVQCGALNIAAIPLLSHRDYDYLLMACALNFVRGEDSFVRAQWAARPFVWHIYPQADNAHHTKLNAFISAVSAAAPHPAQWQAAMLAWNQADANSTEACLEISAGISAGISAESGAESGAENQAGALNPWPDFFAHTAAAHSALHTAARAWSQHLAAQNDLAAGLVRFLRSRLE